MTIAYDPKILTTYATTLYQLADRIVVATAIQWAAIVGIAAYAVGASSGSGPPFLLVGGAIGAAVGAALARPRAAELRLQAQLALCQVQIEFNTRTRA